jgi:4'-phosphopantetheinyl transferase
MSVDPCSLYLETVPKTLKIALHTLVPEEANSDVGALDASLLSEAERQRAARFAFARDRWSYTAAHSLLRAMLAEFHGLPPLAWRFRANDHGRPEVDPAGAAPNPPRFNISHTHGLAVCALTVGNLPEGVEVGVDAECLDRSPNALALAEHCFSARETAWLRSLPESRRSAEFLRLWTLKEAVAKAVGLGLGLDFRTFDCSVDPPEVSFAASSGETVMAWDLNNWFVEPRHWVSLAVRRPPGTRVELAVRHLRGAPLPEPLGPWAGVPSS